VLFLRLASRRTQLGKSLDSKTIWIQNNDLCCGSELLIYDLDPDPSFQIISDPNPTFHVILDWTSDPGLNSNPDPFRFRLVFKFFFIERINFISIFKINFSMNFYDPLASTLLASPPHPYLEYM